MLPPKAKVELGTKDTSHPVALPSLIHGCGLKCVVAGGWLQHIEATSVMQIASVKEQVRDNQGTFGFKASGAPWKF